MSENQRMRLADEAPQPEATMSEWEQQRQWQEAHAEKMVANDKAFAEKMLPKYKCHKEVQAAEIVGVYIYSEAGKGYKANHAVLRVKFPSPEIDKDIEWSYIHVPLSYIDRHNPKPGGYYVLYEDGYQSYSPAKPFEDGYTFINPFGREAIVK